MTDPNDPSASEINDGQLLTPPTASPRASRRVQIAVTVVGAVLSAAAAISAIVGQQIQYRQMRAVEDIADRYRRTSAVEDSADGAHRCYR